METFTNYQFKRVAPSVLCLILLLAVGCQKEPVAVQPARQHVAQGVSVVDGRMVFETLNDLRSTIDALKRMSERERVEWSRSLNYQSLQDFYQGNEGMIESSKNPVYRTKKGDFPYVPDNLFARVLNQNGVYQLGNRVHRITLGGKELTTSEQNSKQLMMSEKNDDVETHTIDIEIKGGASMSSPNAKVAAPDVPVYSYSVDGNHAVFGVFSKTSSFMYQSYAFKLQAREYRGWWIFAGWKEYTASSLVINDAGFYATAFPSNTPYGGGGSGSSTDDDEAYAFLAEFYGPLVLNVQSIGASGSFRFYSNSNVVNYSF